MNEGMPRMSEEAHHDIASEFSNHLKRNPELVTNKETAGKAEIVRGILLLRDPAFTEERMMGWQGTIEEALADSEIQDLIAGAKVPVSDVKAVVTMLPNSLSADEVLNQNRFDLARKLAGWETE